MTHTPSPVWLTRQEAADYLRVATATLDRWVREKKLPRYRIAGKVSARFKTSDLDGIVVQDETTVEPETEPTDA